MQISFSSGLFPSEPELLKPTLINLEAEYKYDNYQYNTKTQNGEYYKHTSNPLLG